MAAAAAAGDHDTGEARDGVDPRGRRGAGLRVDSDARHAVAGRRRPRRAHADRAAAGPGRDALQLVVGRQRDGHRDVSDRRAGAAQATRSLPPGPATRNGVADDAHPRGQRIGRGSRGGAIDQRRASRLHRPRRFRPRQQPPGVPRRGGVSASGLGSVDRDDPAGGQSAVCDRGSAARRRLPLGHLQRAAGGIGDRDRAVAPDPARGADIRGPRQPPRPERLAAARDSGGRGGVRVGGRGTARRAQRPDPRAAKRLGLGRGAYGIEGPSVSCPERPEPDAGRPRNR